MTTALDDPKYYINRELSWLEFNQRVLEEAQDPTNPLLERLKFLAIFSSNLDEFFMIRVANLRELEVARAGDPGPDGLSPIEQLEAIAARAHQLVREHCRCMREEILPQLAEHDIRLVTMDTLDAEDEVILAQRFRDEIFPVLTPMTVDPSHPFPHLPNLSLNLVLTFRPSETRRKDEDELEFAIVEVPSVLDRLIPVPSRPSHFLRLEELIAHFAGELFAGLELRGAWAFRVTRNADLSLEEQEVENLIKDIERELRDRTLRRTVRLEYDADMPEEVLEHLLEDLDVERRDIYPIDTLLHAPSLMHLYGADAHRDLRDPPFNPRLHPHLATNDSIFAILRQRDLLLHHPYESFSTVVELLQHAAADARVLAIKLTLYRTSGDSVIIQALKDAAENGKQVTAVVELKARFDERNNITWARELERAGVHVTYGIVGLKTHCKAALVVRKEGSTIRRYVHLGTGNYNSSTARLYTDLGLLTSDPIIGEDVSHLFNILTGYNARTINDIRAGLQPLPHFHKLQVAPFDLLDRLIELIDEEIELHTPERPGLIQFKVNSLSERRIIEGLYRASMAGVQVRLCVRGICCLRPGIPGLSDNIRVISVLDRFLEHSRIYHFGHGGEHRVYVASADAMPRNLYRRIETMFPIEAPELRERLISEILWISMNDNVKARHLMPDGGYARVSPSEGDPLIRSQERFIELAREAGLKSAPYDKSIREAREQRRRGFDRS